MSEMSSAASTGATQPRRLRKSVSEPAPRRARQERVDKRQSWLETAVVVAVGAVVLGTLLVIADRFRVQYVQSLVEEGTRRELSSASLAEKESAAQAVPEVTIPEAQSEGHQPDLAEDDADASVEENLPEKEKDPVPSAIQAKFASLDSDDSGELGYRELLPLLKPGVPLAQLEAVMQSLDTDSSGGVDVLEYAGAMTQRPRKRQLRPTTLPGPRPRSLEVVDNAPAPRPRPGDTELPSLAPALLNGSTPERLHGFLGRVGGRARRPTISLPPEGLTAKERTAAHRGFCFNYRMSDSISLNRKQLDVRSQACRKKHDTYPMDLPGATVIVVFHNEHISVLLRTLHSILNQSPPRLLTQLIVVDDASVPTDRFDQEHWEALQALLAEYCQQLPKTQLVRLAERRGLMVARMEGVWRATGDVVIFLDSHIEATPGWIEPLLARIKEDPRKVVLPRVDTIDAETFEYSSSEKSGIGVLGFSWSLGQRQWPVADYGQDGTQPAPSPIMPGGLFAADRKEFLRLGGYDQEMRLYGGEEMEISFRTWMCGGAIEHVPCSRVGHVFRTPKYWQGQVYEVPGQEIARNKLRAAEVWMDDYKKLMQYATMLLPAELSLGDVSDRIALRHRLGCAGFDWYLQTVAQGMHVPNISDAARVGALQNKRYGACLDTLGHSGHGEEIDLFTCHGQRGAQSFVMDRDGLVRLPQTNYIGCVAKKDQKLIIEVCDAQLKSARWTWDPSTWQFRPRGKSKCLEVRVGASKYKLGFAKCRENAPEQQWFWDA